MTDTEVLQPDPGSLRAAAEAAELAQAISGLVSIHGCRLVDSDPLAPLARDIARSMTEAGLTVHHWSQHDPRYRLGGVCLLAPPAESRTGGRGIAVSWTARSASPRRPSCSPWRASRHTSRTGTPTPLSASMARAA